MDSYLFKTQSRLHLDTWKIYCRNKQSFFVTPFFYLAFFGDAQVRQTQL